MKLRLANKIVNAVASERDGGRYSEGKIEAALRRVERTIESKRANDFWHVALHMLRKARQENMSPVAG